MKGRRRDGGRYPAHESAPHVSYDLFCWGEMPTCLCHHRRLHAHMQRRGPAYTCDSGAHGTPDSSDCLPQSRCGRLQVMSPRGTAAAKAGPGKVQTLRVALAAGLRHGGGGSEDEALAVASSDGDAAPTPSASQPEAGAAQALSEACVADAGQRSDPLPDGVGDKSEQASPAMADDRAEQPVAHLTLRRFPSGVLKFLQAAPIDVDDSAAFAFMGDKSVAKGTIGVDPESDIVLSLRAEDLGATAAPEALPPAHEQFHSYLLWPELERRVEGRRKSGLLHVVPKQSDSVGILEIWVVWHQMHVLAFRYLL